MSEVDTWSPTAGGNNAAPPDGFPEGMFRRDYNNAARELMASLVRRFRDFEYLDMNGGATVARQSGNQISVAGVDLTATYVAGRRIRWRIGSGSFTNGKVTASTFSGGNTIVTVSGVVGVGVNDCELYVLASIRSAALLETSTGAGDIPVNSQSGALASGAYTAIGNAVGQLPVNVAPGGPLGTAAYKNTSTAIGDVPVNSSAAALGTGAYANTPSRLFQKQTSGLTLNGTAETILNGLGNLTVPGTPDGVKKYALTIVLLVTGDSANTAATLRARIGTNGNLTDAVAFSAPFTVSTGASNTSVITVARFEVVPVANSKLTISTQHGQSGGTHDVTYAGTATNCCYAELLEII